MAAKKKKANNAKPAVSKDAFEMFLSKEMAPLAKKEIRAAKAKITLQENAATSREASVLIERVIAKNAKKTSVQRPLGKILQFPNKVIPISLAAAALLVIGFLINNRMNTPHFLNAEEAYAALRAIPTAGSSSSFAVKSDHPVIKAINLGFYSELAKVFNPNESNGPAISLITGIREMTSEFDELKDAALIISESEALLTTMKSQKITGTAYASRLDEIIKRLKGAFIHDHLTTAFNAGTELARLMISTSQHKDWEMKEMRLFDLMRKLMTQVSKDDDIKEAIGLILDAGARTINAMKVKLTDRDRSKRVIEHPQAPNILQDFHIHRY